MLPAFVELPKILEGARTALVLGAGKLLLEAVFRFPEVEWAGEISKGALAASPQHQLDESIESLVNAAAHYGLPFACRDFVPVLPRVVVTPGDDSVTTIKQPLAAAGLGGGFDVLLSQSALASLGVKPDALHAAVPALLDLLAPGGTAVVNVASLSSQLLPPQLRGGGAPSSPSVLARRTWRFRGGPAALALVLQPGASAAADRPLVLLLHRCSPQQFFPATADDYAAGAQEDADPAAAAAAELRGCAGSLVPQKGAAAAGATFFDPAAWRDFVTGPLQEFAFGSHSAGDAWAQRALLDLAEAMRRWDAAGGRIETPPPARLPPLAPEEAAVAAAAAATDDSDIFLASGGRPPPDPAPPSPVEFEDDYAHAISLLNEPSSSSMASDDAVSAGAVAAEAAARRASGAAAAPGSLALPRRASPSSTPPSGAAAALKAAAEMPRKSPLLVLARRRGSRHRLRSAAL